MFFDCLMAMETTRVLRRTGNIIRRGENMLATSARGMARAETDVERIAAARTAVMVSFIVAEAVNSRKNNLEKICLGS